MTLSLGALSSRQTRAVWQMPDAQQFSKAVCTFHKGAAQICLGCWVICCQEDARDLVPTRHVQQAEQVGPVLFKRYDAVYAGRSVSLLTALLSGACTESCVVQVRDFRCTHQTNAQPLVSEVAA